MSDVKELNKGKSIVEIIEEVAEEICVSYCKYPEKPIPEGKDADWLTLDDDSPCMNCPLDRLQ